MDESAVVLAEFLTWLELPSHRVKLAIGVLLLGAAVVGCILSRYMTCLTASTRGAGSGRRRERHQQQSRGRQEGGRPSRVAPVAVPSKRHGERKRSAMGTAEERLGLSEVDEERLGLREVDEDAYEDAYEDTCEDDSCTEEGGTVSGEWKGPEGTPDEAVAAVRLLMRAGLEGEP